MRLYLDTVGYEHWMHMIDMMQDAIRDLVSADVGVPAFGCTGASFANGPGYDRAVAERIAISAPGRQVTTISGSVVEALSCLGVAQGR